jgi:hypothetical protein
MSSAESEVLSQPFELGFTYTRSTGPVVGRFFTELRDRKIFGNKGADGTVYVPPVEFDPKTAEPVTEFVELGEVATVTTWNWVSEPGSKHLLQKPFAFALLKFEGADVPMLHMVDAGSIDVMKTGMRVKVRWAASPRGHITDIACFEPA